MRARAVATSLGLLLAGRLRAIAGSRVAAAGTGGRGVLGRRRRRRGELLLALELGEEGLVLLVQLLHLPPQPLVRVHHAQVLQAQVRVHPIHLSRRLLADLHCTHASETTKIRFRKHMCHMI